jgi:hypothetical protein
MIELHWDVYLPDAQPVTALGQLRRVFRHFSDRAEVKVWLKLGETPIGPEFARATSYIHHGPFLHAGTNRRVVSLTFEKDFRP